MYAVGDASWPREADYRSRAADTLLVQRCAAREHERSAAIWPASWTRTSCRCRLDARAKPSVGAPRATAAGSSWETPAPPPAASAGKASFQDKVEEPSAPQNLQRKHACPHLRSVLLADVDGSQQRAAARIWGAPFQLEAVRGPAPRAPGSASSRQWAASARAWDTARATTSCSAAESTGCIGRALLARSQLGKSIAGCSAAKSTAARHMSHSAEALAAAERPWERPFSPLPLRLVPWVAHPAKTPGRSTCPPSPRRCRRAAWGPTSSTSSTS
eukprot:scaffold3178_cov282-Pinguiococcus_pyrenoidosus.AAC.11